MIGMIVIWLCLCSYVASFGRCTCFCVEFQSLKIIFENK